MDLSFLFTDATTADSPTDTDTSPTITYGFGTGQGAMSQWSSIADLDLSGDGVRDAVALDFDGDGDRDDAMWDSDGDGRADLATIDTDDDGTPDASYSDTGRGLWDHRVVDVHPDGDSAPRTPPAVPVPEADPPADASGRAADLDDDGVDDDRVIDVDSSGRAEVGLVFAGAAGAAPTRLLIDLDGDGEFDAALIDDDSDGCADVWSTRGQVRFDEDDGVAARG